MESNFTFLNNKWQDLFQIGEAAETYLYNDPNASMIKVGMLGERIAQYVADYEQIDTSSNDKQSSLIGTLHSYSYIPDDIWHTLHIIRKTRNDAVHGGLNSLPRAKAILRKGYELCSWFMEVYGDWQYTAKPYTEPENVSETADYASVIQEHERKIKELSDKIEALRNAQLNRELEETTQPVRKLYSPNSKIDDTDLSVRAKNGLHRLGLFFVKEIRDLDEETIADVRNVGVKTRDEIIAFKDCIAEEQESETVHAEDKACLSEEELLVSYFKHHDISVGDMLLSVRSLNALTNAGITLVSQLVEMGPSQVYKLKNAGKKSAEEIITKTETVIQPVKEKIKDGRITAENYKNKTDEENDQTIIRVFMQHSGASVSIKELIDSAGSEMSASEINKALGRLMSENKIMFDDYGDYTLYCPEFLEVVELLDDQRQKDILQKRIKQGKKLEEIGNEYGVSRERIRQIEAKGRIAAASILKSKYHVEYYAEDKYRNLFTSYETTQNDWQSYFDLTAVIYNYLNMMYKKGQADLDDAVDDESLPKCDKALIQKYLMRTYLVDNNVHISKNRIDIENYLIESRCKDLTTLDQFFDMYQEFIDRHNLHNDQKLRLDNKVKRTRENRIESSMLTLWEQWKQFRYYDVNGNDYTELYDTLSLDTYQNMEISAKKLFLMYPETMAQYDIRNEYELHNLLRKTGAEDRYESLDLGRAPTIKFGTVDRDYMVLSMMIDLAPVSAKQLAEAIEQEYGFSAQTVQASWFKPISDYVHGGVYKIDYPEMSFSDLNALAKLLPDEFYSIAEIKEIYKSNFPGGNVSLINAYNLRKMGFVVNRHCVVKGYRNLKEYFKHLLLKDDEFDISQYKKRYSFVTEFSSVLSEVKDTYEIIETDRNKYINFRKLASMGVTRKDLKNYCESVAAFVSDEYFTVYSLAQDGFVPAFDFRQFGSKLSESILREDKRFNFQWTAGETLFRKSGGTCSRKDLILNTVRREGVVHIDDVVDQIKSVYNIDLERFDIVSAVSNTEIQYEYADGILVCDENQKRC